MTKTERKLAANEDNSLQREHQIFVSHSSADTPAARRLVTRWRRLGYDLFADFNDPTLVRAAKHGRVDAAVTKHLLTAIRNCKIFVFISSEQSIKSGWMPWELGLAHGAVGRVHIYRHDKAELSSLPGREYLSLYKDNEFDRSNEKVYLRKVLDEAAIEAANAAQIEAARDMARRALHAFNEKRFGDVVKELTESPMVQGAATVDALRDSGFNTSIPTAFDSEPHPSTSDSKDSPFPIYSPWLWSFFWPTKKH